MSRCCSEQRDSKRSLFCFLNRGQRCFNFQEIWVCSGGELNPWIRSWKSRRNRSARNWSSISQSFPGEELIVDCWLHSATRRRATAAVCSGVRPSCPPPSSRGLLAPPSHKAGNYSGIHKKKKIKKNLSKSQIPVWQTCRQLALTAAFPHRRVFGSQPPHADGRDSADKSCRHHINEDVIMACGVFDA